MALLYGRAGHVTAQNGGFRPVVGELAPQLLPQRCTPDQMQLLRRCLLIILTVLMALPSCLLAGSVLWEHGQGCPHLACCTTPTWVSAAASPVGSLDPGKGVPGDVEPAQPGGEEVEGGWDAAVCPRSVRPLRGVALEDLFDHDRQVPFSLF